MKPLRRLALVKETLNRGATGLFTAATRRKTVVVGAVVVVANLAGCDSTLLCITGG